MHLCPFCREYESKDFILDGKNYGSRILYETKNFFVFPTLGAFIEGYLLITTKKHFLSLGEMPDHYFPELIKIQSKFRRLLTKNYQSPLFFEHGAVSCSQKAGCCVDHAHLHCVPVNINIIPDVQKFFSAEKIKNLKEVANCYNEKVPYFFIENPDRSKYIFKINRIIPSQFLRQIIAVKIKKTKRWDWRTSPEIKNLIKTTTKMKKLVKSKEK